MPDPQDENLSLSKEEFYKFMEGFRVSIAQTITAEVSSSMAPFQKHQEDLMSEFQTMKTKVVSNEI